MRTTGVECPECGGLKTKVNQSNLDVEGNRVRARRCEECAHLFSTVEVAVPGLSFARTQRSHSPTQRILTPQYAKVTPTQTGVTIRVYGPTFAATCRRGEHAWTSKNIYTNPSTGHQTCRPCRLANARERYHHARRKAPQSILDEQRARWREAYRRKAA